MTRQNWQYWHKAADVDAILDIASRETVTDATTFGGMNNEHRRSKVAWLTGNTDIMDMMWPYVESASNIMGVSVAAIADFQYTEYHGSQEAKYDWHHDVDWNKNDGRDRKLSITVQLSDPSDYEGGELVLHCGGEPVVMNNEKGMISFFPSWVLHQVKPVTKGTRYTLVAWIHGPSFK